MVQPISSTSPSRLRSGPSRPGMAAARPMRGTKRGAATTDAALARRGRLHRRARQLLHGHRVGDRLALCPASRRPAGLPARCWTPQTLGFADFRGNRQYITLGNLSGERPGLAVPDGLPEPAAAEDAGPHVRGDAGRGSARWSPRLVDRGLPGPARAAVPDPVEAFDWNCPQHITPRFTEAELHHALDADPGADRRT